MIYFSQESEREKVGKNIEVSIHTIFFSLTFNFLYQMLRDAQDTSGTSDCMFRFLPYHIYTFTFHCYMHATVHPTLNSLLHGSK